MKERFYFLNNPIKKQQPLLGYKLFYSIKKIIFAYHHGKNNVAKKETIQEKKDYK